MLVFLGAGLTVKRIVSLPHTFGADKIGRATALRAGILRRYVAGQQPYRSLLLGAPGLSDKGNFCLRRAAKIIFMNKLRSLGEVIQLFVFPDLLIPRSVKGMKLKDTCSLEEKL